MPPSLSALRAGYGRKEAAQLLLGAGAQADVQNVDGQTPSCVAQLNREMHMVTFLAEHAGGGKGAAIDKEQDVFL